MKTMEKKKIENKSRINEYTGWSMWRICSWCSEKRTSTRCDTQPNVCIDRGGRTAYNQDNDVVMCSTLDPSLAYFLRHWLPPPPSPLPIRKWQQLVLCSRIFTAFFRGPTPLPSLPPFDSYLLLSQAIVVDDTATIVEKRAMFRTHIRYDWPATDGNGGMQLHARGCITPPPWTAFTAKRARRTHPAPHRTYMSRRTAVTWPNIFLLLLVPSSAPIPLSFPIRICLHYRPSLRVIAFNYRCLRAVRMLPSLETCDPSSVNIVP